MLKSKKTLDIIDKTCYITSNRRYLMDNQYYSIVYDEEELKYFYTNILPRLTETEVYFVSLSARNKYLSEEEREELQLGRTEMFNKTIVRKDEWGRFIRSIRKFECNKRGYTTKNNSYIPEKSIVCYININPSDTIKALGEFKKVLNEYEIEIASIAFNKRQTTNIAQRLNKLDNSLMTAYQQSTGEKTWIDIDCDVNKKYKPHEDEELKEYMEYKGLKDYYWIDTRSGYHLLLKRKELTFNPQDLTKEIYKGYYSYMNSINEIYGSTEVIVNKNAMIPLPGTFQGGYPVRVLNRKMTN
jgi:hypothetical protein